MHKAAIFTAIPIEYEVVRTYLANVRRQDTKTDATPYRVGQLKDIFALDGLAPWEVAIHNVGAGQTSATLEVDIIVRDFCPDIILFVGVAGGRPGKVQLGDVVVASEVVYFEVGKETPSGFIERPKKYRPGRHLLKTAEYESTESTWLDRLDVRVNSASVHIKPVASGEKVITNSSSELWRRVEADFDQVIAVETEGHGFHFCAHERAVQAIMVRGISDLLDNKNSSGDLVDDNRQRTAAERAMAFAVQVICSLNTSWIQVRPEQQGSRNIVFRLVIEANVSEASDCLRIINNILQDQEFCLISVEPGSIIITASASAESVAIIKAMTKTKWLSLMISNKVKSMQIDGALPSGGRFAEILQSLNRIAPPTDKINEDAIANLQSITKFEPEWSGKISRIIDFVRDYDGKWREIEDIYNKKLRVTGRIVERTKGGFSVDLSASVGLPSAVAFLPGSQVDIRPVRDITPLLGTAQPVQILKMDRSRGNIVVSRRAVLEEARAEQLWELIENLREGQILEGVVKNITDYGAFVDLGGVDGLLHVTDIAWKHIDHPSEVLHIGQTIKVQVIRFNPETQRISLGIKQLDADPWEGVEARYPFHAKFSGRVTNITDYGAFVELEPGIEGLVHVSEMSWTNRSVHPSKIVTTSQEVEVVVLDVDPQKRRISLSLRQTMNNPWEDFLEKFPVGTIIEGEIKSVTEFGVFIGLPRDIDGMVHLSDLEWDTSGEKAIQSYKKGDVVKVKVLDVDIEKERIALGIKQLSPDPFLGSARSITMGNVVTCTVVAVAESGLEVSVEGVRGFIRKSELSRERSEQRPERFSSGEMIEATVTHIDRTRRRISLSVKAREEEEALKSASDSMGTLGDVLAAALRKIQTREGGGGGEGG